MYEIKNLAKKTLNKKILTDFLDFTNNELKIDKPYSVYFVDDKVNAADPLGKTAMYNPSTSSVYIYATNRHFKDILRSIAHELMHHKQNCDGRLDKTDEEGSDNLMGLETEAQKAGIIVRMFEDGRKEELQEQEGEESTTSVIDWKQKLYDRQKKAYDEMMVATQGAEDLPPKLGRSKLMQKYSLLNRLKRQKCKQDEYKVGMFCYPKEINEMIIDRMTGKPTLYANWRLNDVLLAVKMKKMHRGGETVFNYVEDPAIKQLLEKGLSFFKRLAAALRTFRLAPMPAKDYIKQEKRFLSDPKNLEKYDDFVRALNLPRHRNVEIQKAMDAVFKKRKKRGAALDRIYGTPAGLPGAVNPTKNELNEQKGKNQNFIFYSLDQTDAAYLVMNLIKNGEFLFPTKKYSIRTPILDAKLPEMIKNDIIRLAKSSSDKDLADTLKRAKEIAKVSAFSFANKRGEGLTSTESFIENFSGIFAVMGAVPLPWFWLADAVNGIAYLADAVDESKKIPLDRFYGTKYEKDKKFMDGMLSLFFAFAFSGAIGKSGEAGDVARGWVSGMRKLDLYQRTGRLVEWANEWKLMKNTLNRVERGIEKANSQILKTEQSLKTRFGMGEIGDVGVTERLSEYIGDWKKVLGTAQEDIKAQQKAAENLRAAVVETRQTIRSELKSTEVVDNLRARTVNVKGKEYPWWQAEMIEGYKKDEKLISFVKENIVELRKNLKLGKTASVDDIMEVLAIREVDTYVKSSPKTTQMFVNRAELAISRAEKADADRIARELLDKLEENDKVALLTDPSRRSELIKKATKGYTGASSAERTALLTKGPDKIKVQPGEFGIPRAKRRAAKKLGQTLEKTPNPKPGHVAIKEGDEWFYVKADQVGFIEASQQTQNFVEAALQTIVKRSEGRLYKLAGKTATARGVRSFFRNVFSPEFARETGVFSRSLRAYLLGNRYATNFISSALFDLQNLFRYFKGQAAAARFVSNTSKIIRVVDKIIAAAVFKLHWSFLLYIRFYRPFCGATFDDYKSVILDDIINLSDSIANKVFDVDLGAEDRQEKPLTQAEKQMGIDLIKMKYPNINTVLSPVASCKKLRSALKKDPKAGLGYLQIFYQLGEFALVNVSTDLLDKVKSLFSAEHARLIKDLEQTAFNLGVSFEKLRNMPSEEREKFVQEKNKELQDELKKAQQKAEGLVNKAKPIATGLADAVKAAKDAVNNAPKINLDAVPLGNASTETGVAPLDPVQKRRQKKPKQESVSISDYRQKILEERLVKLTIGFTK